MTTAASFIDDPQPEPELLKVCEAMAALRISRSKLYDLIRTHQLRSITIGRARRVPTKEIREYIRKRVEESA